MSDIGVNYVVLHVADLDPGIVSAARRTDRLELVLDDGSRRLYRLRW
jgi:hypothetical protein